MRHPVLGPVLGAVFAMAAPAILGAGCSSPAPGPNSFTNVYATVLAPSCTSDYCHSHGVSLKYSNLDLSSQTIAYWSLYDHLLEGPACSGDLGKRVVPYDPEDSALYQKVSEANPPCGVQMPADPNQLWPSGPTPQAVVFSGTALPADQQQLIYNWIKEGAQNN